MWLGSDNMIAMNFKNQRIQILFVVPNERHEISTRTSRVNSKYEYRTRNTPQHLPCQVHFPSHPWQLLGTMKNCREIILYDHNNAPFQMHHFRCTRKQTRIGDHAACQMQQNAVASQTRRETSGDGGETAIVHS